MCSSEVDPSLIYCRDEAWFLSNGQQNIESNAEYSAYICGITHELPLFDFEVGDWCAAQARYIIYIKIQ
jgi:hypothetical protein